MTTILSLLDRPGLREWKLNWAIECALAMPNPTIEDVRAEADAYAEWAASQGSKIHLGLSEHFNGRTIQIEPEVDEVVREFWPWYRESGLSVQRAEHVMVSPLGWAGTVDYLGTYHGRTAIVDFKTQDFEDVRKALFYDEHALQLSGYALGAGLVGAQRLSVILSRQVPGLVALHDWTPQASRWDRAWLALWETWQHIKNYYPVHTGGLYDPDDPN